MSNSNYLVYSSFHSELNAAIDKYAKGSLLDIGCGNKPYESWMKEKVTEYIGCDIVQSSANKVDVLCSANKIPLENERFDTIFSSQTKVGRFFILVAVFVGTILVELINASSKNRK